MTYDDVVARVVAALVSLQPHVRHEVVTDALRQMHDPEPIRHVRNRLGGVVENPDWWAWEQRQLEAAHLARQAKSVRT